MNNIQTHVIVYVDGIHNFKYAKYININEVLLSRHICQFFCLKRQFFENTYN